MDTPKARVSRARIMEAYAALPPDQLISDTVIYTHQGASPEHWAAAAVLGYSRGGLYLDTARTLLAQILADAGEITWRMDAYDVVQPTIGGVLVRSNPAPLTPGLLVEAVSHQQGAMYLRHVAEILWHFYASSLQHAWHFLENSVRIIDPGFAATPEDQEWIELVRTFRNHIEHRDKAVRDIASRDWQSMSRYEQGIFELGYRLDDAGNVLFVPLDGKRAGQQQRMPINQAGFDQAARLCQGIWHRVRARCLQRLDHYFTAHPEAMPALADVGATMVDVMEPVRSAHARR